MRITHVRSHACAWPIEARGAARGRRDREAILVEVRGDGGEIGLGEAAPLAGMSSDSLAEAAAAIARFAARVPFDVEDIRDAFAIATHDAPDAPSAQFAIETALYDALARRAGGSIAALICRPGSAPATRLAIAAVVDDPDEARAAFAAGVRVLKLKLGPDEPLDRVRAIADAAPGARLRIDANQSWPTADVPARLAALTALVGDAIAYVEEPCRDTMSLLVAPPLDTGLACRLALDESLVARAKPALSTALRNPRLAAIVVKPTLLGIGGALRLAQLAHAHGTDVVVSHGLEGPIGTAACVELALALGDPAPAGLAAHPALAGWRIPVPHLAADHVHAVAGPGLSSVAADLDAVLAAAPEPS
jgi:o-succinylbenzoate synthase